MGYGIKGVMKVEKDTMEEIKFDEKHFVSVQECPWCGGNIEKILYTNQHSAKVKECEKCGFVYSDKILNNAGLEYYWSTYLSKVHTKDELQVHQRKQMYKIDFEFISTFINCENKNVLDVGCGNGDFLSHFEKAKATCYGVEYGKEAAKAASERYKIWLGEFPNIEINEKFDLIIFRGVLQYCINPKLYLKKAMSLLKEDGYLFITSTPNSQSFCFRLFKGNFVLPVSVTDYYGFKESIITDYISELGGKFVCSRHFYEETPYANIEEDILKVAKAITYRREGKEVDFKSPAFFDNMLTLVYKK